MPPFVGGFPMPVVIEITPYRKRLSVPSRMNLAAGKLDRLDKTPFPEKERGLVLPVPAGKIREVPGQRQQ